MILARTTALVLGALAFAAGLASCGGDKNYANEYEGKSPPALVATESTWVNVEGSPTLATFRGKVIFLEFGFLR